MTCAIPLPDGSFGIAQAGDAMMTNVVYVVLFSDRFMTLPVEPPPLAQGSAIGLLATWRRALNRGDWISLKQAPEVFKKRDFPANDSPNPVTLARSTGTPGR